MLSAYVARGNSLERVMVTSGSDVPEALAALARRYEGRGVVLMRLGEVWAFRTAPDLGHLMQREVVETRKLSRAAIETLAIIAYHQPVTRAEIEEIRGVAAAKGTLKGARSSTSASAAARSPCIS